MTEGEAETATERPKSPGELARERVAPEGYTWLMNHPIYTSEKGREGWLKDIQANDPTVTDIKIIELAFDEQGKPIERGKAAYITRKSPEKSESEPTFISRVLRRK